MTQQPCYADSPDMPVPFAGKGLTGMNAEDEWCCGSSLSMTDLVLTSVSVYQALPDIPNPESRIWSEQQGEYLSEVCVSEQDTRTPDVYDQIQASGIHPM